MPLDPDFKKHLHSLMVEVYNSTIDENDKFKRERISQARHSASAYTEAALHATENRISKTIAKYLEAVSIWGFEITPSFERDMISEFEMLTAGPNQVQLPPMIKGSHINAVQAHYGRERSKLANKLVREGTNRLRELKMKARTATHNIKSDDKEGPIGEPVNRDSLLPIGNRKAYDERLAEYVKEATSGHPLSLVMVDVDHFKSFNDKYGHEIGDSVLIEIAKVLQAVTHGQGEAFRYGGEELVVLLPNHTSQEAASIAERARRSIESLRVSKVDEAITASFGVATLPHTAATVDQLFKQADDAMYESKDSGRNRVSSAVPNAMSEATPKKARLLLELSLEPLGINGGTNDPRIPYRWFMLGLKNAGVLIAKFPTIRFATSMGVQVDPYGVDGNYNFGLPKRATDHTVIVFQGGADDVIHPGETRQISKLMQVGLRTAQKGNAVIDRLSSQWRTLETDTWVFSALTFSCEISCEGVGAAKNEVFFHEERIDF